MEEPAGAISDDDARPISTGAVLGGQGTTPPPAAPVKWGLSPYSEAEKVRMKSLVDHDHALVHAWSDKLDSNGPVRNGPRLLAALSEVRNKAYLAEGHGEGALQEEASSDRS